MLTYFVKGYASAGQRFPPDAGIPLQFHTGVETWWKERNASVGAFFLEQPGRDAWVSLGRKLCRALSVSASSGGVCADGEWSPDSLYQASKKFEMRTSTAAWTLNWTREPHPAVNGLMVANVTWCAMEVAPGAWLEEIWSDVSDADFDAAQDLMVAYYEERAVASWDGSRPFYMERFVDWLPLAVGWVIPLDGIRGFIVGADSHTALSVEIDRAPT